MSEVDPYKKVLEVFSRSQQQAIVAHSMTRRQVLIPEQNPNTRP